LGTNNALGPAGTDRCTILVERRPHHPEPQPTPCARTPRAVPLPDPAIDVAVGDDHTCALTTRHELFCWGWVYNIDFAATRPKRIADGGARLVEIASGSRHVCGLDTVGRAYCWGRNWDGQVGTAAPREGSAELTPVSGAPPLRRIAGGDDHTCGIAEDGRAFCWGSGFEGQLGGVVPLHDADRPTLVAGDHVWRTIAAGFNHTCATTVGGSLYCWGSGLGFRSEPGSYHEQPEPFLVAGWR
jgi:alpha-tubulin suppressor-like RCC1 family protein